MGANSLIAGAICPRGWICPDTSSVGSEPPENLAARAGTVAGFAGGGWKLVCVVG